MRFALPGQPLSELLVLVMYAMDLDSTLRKVLVTAALPVPDQNLTKKGTELLNVIRIPSVSELLTIVYPVMEATQRPDKQTVY